jgi:hypothetical protein
MKLGTWMVLLWFELVGLTALTAWAQGPGSTSMSIRLKDGYLVVAKGSIGRLNNLTFLVDTGTARTLMDSRIAKQLQLAGVAHKLTVFDQIAAGRQMSPAAKVASYFLVLTKLTQSPWFLNFRGMVKVFQPPFWH